MFALILSTLITVTGQGVSTASPDMATETFTIATNAETASRATSDNNARYDRLVKALEGLGIASADIRTTSYNVNYTPPPQPQQVQGGPALPPVRERYGYFVYRGITVTLHKLPLVGKAVDAAIASGVTDIGGVAYGVSDRTGQRDRALRAAVSDARAQAEAMAAAAGLHVTRIRTMQQGFAQPPVPVMMKTMAAAPAPPTEIEPSSVETQASVTITYEAG
jgi:uncharacterized protein YggE